MPTLLLLQGASGSPRDSGALATRWEGQGQGVAAPLAHRGRPLPPCHPPPCCRSPAPQQGTPASTASPLPLPRTFAPPPVLRGTGLRVQVSTRALRSLSQHPGSGASTLLLTPHPSQPLAPRLRQHLLEFFYLNKIYNTVQVPLSVLKVEDLKIACEGSGMGGSTDRPWLPIATEWLGWVGGFIKCACVCVQALMARGCPHSSCPWTLRPLLSLLHPL